MSETAKTPKNRIVTLDLMKGIAIVGVVVLHLAVLQMHSGAMDDGSNFSFSVKAIPYSVFCAFIIISGYFHVRGRGFLENIKKRILRYLIYFVIAVFLLNSAMYLILLLQGYDLDPSSLWDVIWKTLVGKGAFSNLQDAAVYGGAILAPFEVTHALYFFQLLIVGFVIFYAVADRVLDDNRKLFAAIFILITITVLYIQFVGILLPFYAHLGPLAAAFLLIGAYMKKIDFYGRLENATKDKKYWPIFAASIIVLLAMCFLTPKDPSLLNCNVGPFGGFSFYTFVILTIAGCVAFSYIMSWFKDLRVMKGTFGKAGECTIEIFVFHMFVAKCLACPFVTFDTEVWFHLSFVQGFILAIVTCAVIVVLKELYLRYIRTSG